MSPAVTSDSNGAVTSGKFTMVDAQEDAQTAEELRYARKKKVLEVVAT